MPVNDPELRQAAVPTRSGTVLVGSDWSDSSAADKEPVIGHRGWRRLTWAALFALILLLVVMLPPLLNVSRYQRRVAQSISQSIGRPVYFDSITAHVLPWPGFTIQNFVVGEDPAFGAEPAMRANVVEARLRVRSLWRRRVEFARIRLQAPSVNLVRRDDGVWNLQSIVTQAGNVENAPTSQQHAGAAPRFPYVEATAARVNLKLDQSKLPYSLVDTDFALWLPNEREWHLRLAGRPLRTDTDVSDVGLLEVDGTLGRGTASAAQAPLALRADWKPTPMGEAAKLLAGHDTGWRGAASAELTIHGTPSRMLLTGDLHVHDLRRAEFVPHAEMQVDAHCEAIAMGVLHQVHQLHCTLPTRTSGSLLESIGLLGRVAPETMPTNGPGPLQDATTRQRLGVRPGQNGGQTSGRVLSTEQALPLSSAPGIVTLSAELPDAMNLDSASAQVDLQDASPEWALSWMRLFSQRISPSLTVSGDLDLQFTRTPGPSAAWTGQAICQCSLPPATPVPSQAVVAATPSVADRAWILFAGATLKDGRPALQVMAQPIDSRPGDRIVSVDAGVSQVSGQISGSGYLLRFASTAVAQYGGQLIPTLGDSLSADLVGPVQAERAWGGAQHWIALPPATPAKRTAHHRR